MRVAIRQECQECRQFPHVMQLYSNVLECDHEMNLKQITAQKCYMWDGWTFYILFILKLLAASVIFWYHEKTIHWCTKTVPTDMVYPITPPLFSCVCVLVIFFFHRNAFILIDVCDVKQSHIMFVGYIYIGFIVYMYVYICIYTHCITIHPRTVAHISTISTISSLSPLSPFKHASLVAYPSNLPILPSWLIIRIAFWQGYNILYLLTITINPSY